MTQIEKTPIGTHYYFPVINLSAIHCIVVHSYSTVLTICTRDNMRTLRVLTLAVFTALASSQQYGDYDQDYGNDYSQDSLYHDYAMKQQEKEVGKA